MGGFVFIFFNLFNNYFVLMVGIIILIEMGFDFIIFKIIYFVNIIGSDMGLFLLLIGILVFFIWMYILKENYIKVKWKDYLKVLFIVILFIIIVMFFFYFIGFSLFFFNIDL